MFSALVLHWWLAAQPGGFLATGRMTDTDSWTRLIRVLALREGGRWFDEIIPHLNAPDGLSIHWPRLFDLAILAPAV
ncbi:MAG: hypothetical protein NZ523_09285, partial [Elioraea sp.]|nr:hypothetical protein [Elioraea sp.]